MLEITIGDHTWRFREPHATRVLMGGLVLSTAVISGMYLIWLA